ncbi:MAG: Nif3-like dinuclear metal center hexameric protein [Candidatus Nanopelagicales bacterium]
MPTLRQIIDCLERRYPPAAAEPWDAVGPVTGVLTQQVDRVLWAMDPVESVVDEAIAEGADLIVTRSSFPGCIRWPPPPRRVERSTD